MRCALAALAAYVGVGALFVYVLPPTWEPVQLPAQVGALLIVAWVCTYYSGTSPGEPGGAPNRRRTVSYLDRSAIFDADDSAYDEVEIPEWGGTVRIRSITGVQRDQYEESLMKGRGDNREMNLRNARAKLIVLCAVDADGRPMFTSEDVSRLGRKNARPVDRLFEACKRIAGLTKEDVDRLTEDFGQAPDEDSPTD